MSVRIFEDVQEALAREVRRITFHDTRTQDNTVLEESFNPITGELTQLPIEADFNDSSVDGRHIQYPHFFVKLLRTREDRFTSRGIPPYGNNCEETVKNAPKAYEIIVGGPDGTIDPTGADLTTSIFNIRKVETDFLLRLLSGNNKGTYFVDSITASDSGAHTITVSSDLARELPSIVNFNATTRVAIFSEPVDLNTVEVGDTFEDSLAATFAITAIDLDASSITLGGVATPDLSEDGKITRSGDVFKNTDTTPITYIVMDPDQIVTRNTSADGTTQGTTSITTSNPQIPIDAFYLIRIDSVDQATHIEVLNRVWEEFNPPRTGLPTVVRDSESAEQQLTEDIAGGGSTTVKVADNSKFEINDPVFIFNDLRPTKDSSGEGFQQPFQSIVVNKISTDILVLRDTVPDTFVISDCSKIVSNAEFRIHMFHFVDHVTRDVEGAQYWVHEFTFWVQIWVDRLEQPITEGVIQDVDLEVESSDTLAC